MIAVGLLIWLVFLFSFIGIAASDFFIPNLATIADAFGLDDNIAGVTFLAFGNGSPDLFSTLSAMRAGSGSLAIGELIGAASFIVSVVAGSMCVIQSFHVNPVPFVRDVGFFSVAIALLFCTLWDGLIKAWEAALLAGLYVIYVIVVVVSTWWDNWRGRKRRSLEEARCAFISEPVPSIAIYVDDEPYRDNRKGVYFLPYELTNLLVMQRMTPRSMLHLVCQTMPASALTQCQAGSTPMQMAIPLDTCSLRVNTPTVLGSNIRQPHPISLTIITVILSHTVAPAITGNCLRFRFLGRSNSEISSIHWFPNLARRP